MKPEAVIVVDVIGALFLAVVYALLRQRQLSIGLAALWIALIGGLMVVVTTPPLRALWFSMSAWVFQSPPYLVSLVAVVAVFLLYLSVVVSALQRQVRDISRHIALTAEPPPAPLERDDVRT
jgi:hypothetical protein